MPNRLINEQSLYLQQHAHNPVDWYAWGDEAFNTARNEGKPLLVSIGYAACHWCHVMERESFEDAETAAYMNEHFINVKVDREEHPDVDQMYMDAVQAISQSGGWPLNVFVTPNRVPFYGGTYYPPKPMYSRPSWIQVLQQINKVWTEQNDEVTTQSEQMLSYLKQLSIVALNKEAVWDKTLCRKLADNMLASADEHHGGFGTAPKFPATMAINYLLEHYHFTGYVPALKHALKSLDAMAAGGLYDQLGGGFARYSTDAQWLAPHFEKMLYDNALLIVNYTNAFAITQVEKYKQIAEETIDFVNRELLSTEGGYYSALDADSEGAEGKYYTWTWEEWNSATGGDEVLEYYFGIKKSGNWEHTNILHVAAQIDDLKAKFEETEDAINRRIKLAKSKLLKIRETRIRPATDDKCILSWNALMNLALSRAGAVFGREDYIEMAKKHAAWVQSVYCVDGKWMHTYKNGQARICAKLDDLAFIIAALLQLASVTGENEHIIQASLIATVVENDFLHENKSFFYYSSVKQDDIPVRKTDLYDGALPSANSIMANNLITLGMLTERSNLIEQGRYMINQLSAPAVRYATSYAGWALYGQRACYGNKTIVLSGNTAFEVSKALNKAFMPNGYIITAKKDNCDIPLLVGKASETGLKVMVCDEESCSSPLEDVSLIANLLKK